MQRYIIPPLTRDYQTQPIILSDDFHHHMVHVMRMKQGEQVYLADNSGISFVAELIDISANTVSLKWVADEDRSTELPVKITIACGLPKGDKLEYIVQKGTELGAAAFLPFAAKNAVVKWTADKSAKKTAAPAENCERGRGAIAPPKRAFCASCAQPQRVVGGSGKIQ